MPQYDHFCPGSLAICDEVTDQTGDSRSAMLVLLFAAMIAGLRAGVDVHLMCAELAAFENPARVLGNIPRVQHG